jgi:hypothetical protein
MSVPFVATLRARPGTLRFAQAGPDTIVIRAQVAEAWDALRIEVSAHETVNAVKERALEAMLPTAEFADDYAVSLGGIEILDETVSLAAAGVRNGSTLLIQHRRRRPVR